MPLSTSDRQEILELTARYSRALDGGDADAFAGVFTDDGVLVLDTGGPVREHRGRGDLRAFIGGVKGLSAQRRGRHFNTNHVVQGDGDTATHGSYLVFLANVAPAARPLTGTYEDRLTKVAGEWKFNERRVTVDQPASAE